MSTTSVEQRQVFLHPPLLPGSKYLVNPTDFPGSGRAGDFESFNMVREDAKQASKAAVSHLVGFFMDFDIIDFLMWRNDGLEGTADEIEAARKYTKNELLNTEQKDQQAQKYTDHLLLIADVLQSVLPEMGSRAVVATGYGYHVHFWFSTPVNVSGLDGDKIKDKYEACMKRLIKQINEEAGFNLADEACINVNRYVRMPGAYNRKGVMDEHHGELRQVRVVTENPEARISADEFFIRFKPAMGRPKGITAQSSIDKLHQGKEWKNLPAWFTGKYALSSLRWVELLTECDLYIDQKDENRHFVECLNADKHGIAKDKDCTVSEKDSGWWSFHCFHSQCQRPEILSVCAYLEHCGEEKVAQFCARLNADAEKARKEVADEEENEEPEAKYKHKYEYDDTELAELIVEDILEGNLGYSVMDKSFYLYNGQFWVTRGQAKATLALVMPAFDELRKYRYLKVNKNDEAKWCRYRFSAQKEQGVLQCIVRYCMKRQNGDLREQRHIGLSFRNGFLSALTPEDGLTKNHQRNGVLAGHYMDFDYVRPEVEDDDFVGALSVACPVISRVLHRLWKNDIDTQGNIKFFLQYLGAALLGKTIRYQKALLLVGPGRSGKSSILQLFRLCFPPDSVSGVSIQEMESRFGAGSLIGKRLNMVFDMASDMIMETARFKSAVCGEPMTIETKGIQGSVHHLTAAHVYACNTMPPVRRGDSGWWRRFIALKCDNVLLDHEVDTKLESKMMPEIHALICLALECSFNIGDTYDVPKSSTSVVGSWEIAANPIAMFLQQNYVVIPEEDKITGPSSVGAPASIGVSSRTIEDYYNETMRKSGHKGIFSTGWPQLLSDAVKVLGWPGLTDKKVMTASGRNFVYPFRRI